jgi:endonuclease G, mitochondrial
VPTGSASLADYRNSGYDRGHLFPAGDAWDSASMNDCFYLSNMSPQNSSFNSGIWALLEAQVRTWAIDFDTIYIATGGILYDGLPTIGTDSVAVPEYFYKVILSESSKDTMGIGFILKNEGSQSQFSSFAITIDSVEEVTGIDFFPGLSDSLESRVESVLDTSKWLTNSRIISEKYAISPNHFRNNYISDKEALLFDIMGRKISHIGNFRKNHLLLLYRRLK